MGRDYPQGYSYFRPRLHRAFMANAALRDEEAIRRGIERAKFVQKGELGELVFTRRVLVQTKKKASSSQQEADNMCFFHTT